AIVAQAAQRGIEIELVRNGTRGMLWLEPLLEVVTPAGRVAYGPVELDDVPGLFDANVTAGGDHPLALGLTEEIPYFKKQERLTFA
ncbi:formate dehydrogenase, partial [Pandoraea pneumonica]